MTLYKLPKYKLIIGPDDIDIGNEGSEILVNPSLKTFLNSTKDLIPKHLHEWDTFKKFTNPYEYIHTSVPTTKQSVCKYRPISRAFFKLNEILNDLTLLEEVGSQKMRSFHLAEGPGGFIEAVALARERDPRDEYIGMTLIDPSNESVPGWEKVHSFLEKTPAVKLEYGATGTGDLLEPENLRHCFMKYRNTMDLITADGGFDFSKDYNHQENDLTKLLLAQIFYAISLQKCRGNFVLKVFDMCTQLSVDVAFLLNSLYSEVYIVKPFTSRYANSERYIVCKGFRLVETEKYAVKFYSLLTKVKLGYDSISSLLNFATPRLFLDKLQEINAILGQQQIDSIKSTLALIRNKDSERIDQLRKSAIHRCIAYCVRHNLPHHKTSLPQNMFLTKTS
jgi:23S rRNA U2552 (ribose-2'-O)-methylase RlmE/FtsJ